MNLSAAIKEYALYLGYAKIGFTPADDFEGYLEKLEERGAMYDFHWRNPRDPAAGAKPRSLMPEARTVIVMAWDYAQSHFPEKLLPLVGRVYQARCYYPPAHSLNGLRFQRMIDFLREQGCQVNPDILIPARWAAAQAGVTRFGRNTFAYVDGVGSFVILHTLVIDKELEYDRPTWESRCPADCRRCLEACPTKALYEPYKMNPRLCLAFNAWKNQEGAGCGISPYIPAEIREKMDCHVHGCDICQEVCPRNHKKLQSRFPADQFLDLIAGDLTLNNLLTMPEGFFQNRVQPIMYNYISEPKYFQRNAAVALGNLGDPAAGPVLADALSGGDELVRGHAAWALGRIGGAAAKKSLEQAALKESAPENLREIKSALSRMS